MLRFALCSLALLLAACGSDDDVTRGEEGRLQLGSEEARTVVERSVRLGARTLVIDAEAGSVTVVGTDGDTAELRFEQVARGSSATTAQKKLGRMSIEEAGDGEIYQYVVRTDDAEGTQVNVEARVPRATPLQIGLENGTVRLSGTAGNIGVEAENGSIEAAGLAGQRVDLRTTLGNVEAGFAALSTEADVRLETENGALVLALPAEANATVDASTETGSISVQGLGFTDRNLDEDGVSQRFRGRLGQGGAKVRAVTEVGTITLRDGHARELDGLVLDLFTPRDDTTVVPAGAPVAPTQ
jgi:DUF4097 and DUF4098 domain-containing protein YvlB